MQESQTFESGKEISESDTIQKKKMKFRVDPIDDLTFDGEYEVTESEPGSDEESSEEESTRKRKQPKPKKIVKIDRPHIVMNVSDTKYPVIKFVGRKVFKWILSNDPEQNNWDLFWTDNAVQPEQLGRMQPHQKINHFPGMYSLARKNHLGRNLMKMRKQFPDDYKFFPQTWLLPSEYSDFRSQFQKGKAKTFIVKPEASCQGRGIFLTRSIDSINPEDHYVVQRYMHKPFLIDGLKFDLRVYVLLAGCDPMRIFVYRDGLVRLATEPYIPPTNSNLEDMCMHLTNYAINKDNPNFVFNQDRNKMDVGHKRGIEVVFGQLQQQGHDINKLWHEIDKILIKTICSVQPNLSHHYKSCQPDNFANNMCFEVLGFDIFLDNKLKPHLLEVNHTPSFTTDTPLDSHIKKCLIQDTLRIMNINTKTKYDIVSQRRELMQTRVLTGKKQKLTADEKKELTFKAQKERDEYEAQFCGGYRKIYPLEDAGDYDKFLTVALKQYEDWTGANIRRNTKKVLEPAKPPAKKKVLTGKLPQIKPKIDNSDSCKDIKIIPEDTEDCEEHQEEKKRIIDTRPKLYRPIYQLSGQSRNGSRENNYQDMRGRIGEMSTNSQQLFEEKGKYQKLKHTQKPPMIQPYGGNFLMPKIFDMQIQFTQEAPIKLNRGKALQLNQVYPPLLIDQRFMLQFSKK